DMVSRAAGQPIQFRVRTWDGGLAGPSDSAITIHLTRPRALRRLLWQPNELGLARAFVSGDLTVDGDLVGAIAKLIASRPVKPKGNRSGLHPGQHSRFVAVDRVAAVLGGIGAARRLGALGPPVKPPPGEVKLRGTRHSKRRDAAAISHHYDVGNDFYRLLLDESMTYSCAYWQQDPSPAYTLADAQADKYALISRKLGLRAGQRLLDVGCGWGGMLMHAAANHGVTGVGITLSSAQASLAKLRVAAAGLGDRIEIRLCDYRELAASNIGKFDAISSIGMAEHVGATAFAGYAAALYGLLVDGGRLLNHQISMPGGTPHATGPSFINRYVFPDGELLPVGEVVGVIEGAGFEVRDVESLRENYYLTLVQWLENLRRNREAAIKAAGEPRTRTWELYIAGSAAAFRTAHIGIHQTLAVKTVGGNSGLPRIRTRWLCPSPAADA
ncbi:MAG: class I SAM-dependent methyltransferase, partial [Acidothermaceae bacterium]